jgi:nifR3 family TIM-barrel protein
MLVAAQMVLKYQPDVIDINLGCPSRSVTSRGAGAALMQKPEVIGKAISQLVKHIPLPITAKIRLGWDDKSLNYLEIAHIIEDSGGSLVAIHGRTRAQAYQGAAVWTPGGEVKQALKIPVLINGDIRTPEDIQTALEQTGCDGVMVGRAAMGNPWLFRKRKLDTVGLDETIHTIHRHLEKMIAFYDEAGGVILFRKHLKTYLKRFNLKRSEMVALMTAPTRQEVTDLLILLKERIENREEHEV